MSFRFLTLFMVLSITAIEAQIMRRSQEADRNIEVENTEKLAKFIGVLPDGSEIPAKVQIPKMRFSPEDQLSIRSVNIGEKQITFEKVIPFILPQVPEPKPRIEKTADMMSAVERENLIDLKGKASRFAFIGATVYRLKNSPEIARTFLRFRLSQDAEPFEAWSTADWEYLTGFGAFEGKDGKEYSSIMTISISEIQDFSEISEALGKKHSFFEIPKSSVKEKATFLVAENKANPVSLAALQAFHDLYNQELPRLKAALEGRKAASLRRAEALRADPPEKKDVVFRYWRLDKAGRNGIEAKPAIIR